MSKHPSAVTLNNLRKMNPRLEPFFNQSMDCLCIANYDGYFVKTNPAFSKLLGYSDAELKSRLISEFIFPEDRERTALHREKLKNKVPLVNFENRYVCKSGNLIWLHWTSIPHESEELIYAIAKDITHFKKMEMERNSQLGRLSEVNEKLKQQNYITCHDLRSPLNNLMSLVNLIDLSHIDDDETKEILGLIKLSAEGLKNRLSSYLDNFKANELSEDSLEMVSLENVFKKVQYSINSLIEAANVTFKIDFSAFDEIGFSNHYMESIFLNMITNSIKYARPSVPPIITMTTEKRNGKKLLIFSDNGLGFDMDKVGHQIFKLNQKFHGNADSNGVGLYLIHNQVTSLGGSIEVKSEVNSGTTFTITFKS
ncbi:PAS domain-containing sensor histidine kinase [Flagellimonas crocea]|uniref:PAS domain-containing sensor histidine kinase n=1 Tax=Flagellimonas crocea TaxID=3067311 RepID=UPI00296FDD2D|nr:PAS domain-containing sensor histidine kinase [Muricauda sp. DH64]